MLKKFVVLIIYPFQSFYVVQLLYCINYFVYAGITMSQELVIILSWIAFLHTTAEVTSSTTLDVIC